MPPSDRPTTIKVDKRLRDRISAAAAQEHQTINKFLESVLAQYERRQRLASVAAAYNDADTDSLDTWRDETQQWEAIDTDTTASQ